MFEFVFIDPSPNLELLSRTLHSMGRTVVNVYTKDFTVFHPKNLWVFMDGRHFRINDGKGAPDADIMVCMLKKPFFAKFRLKSLKEKLSAIDPLLAGGTFQDYMLFTGQLKTGAELPITVSSLSFDEITAKYPTSTVVTSRLPAPNGKHAVTYWRTDYDIAEALGNDYYFFFDGKSRHELYRRDNLLVTVSEQKTKLDWLKQMNPTLARFQFEKVKSVSFHQNQNPWLQKYSSKIYIVNDYSWQGVYVQMPENWAKTFRKLVCIEKKR